MQMGCNWMPGGFLGESKLRSLLGPTSQNISAQLLKVWILRLASTQNRSTVSVARNAHPNALPT